ncbi:hypothetical protein BH23PLA1_BH23PLA1_00780 [soil metagenome]
MADEHEHEHEHEHGEIHELALDTQSQIFLALRQQNLSLLEIASQVAGYSGDHSPLKPAELSQAMKSIWEVYSELYAWIDPEESEDEDEGEGDEE